MEQPGYIAVVNFLFLMFQTCPTYTSSETCEAWEQYLKQILLLVILMKSHRPRMSNSTHLLSCIWIQMPQPWAGGCSHRGHNHLSAPTADTRCQQGSVPQISVANSSPSLSYLIPKFSAPLQALRARQQVHGPNPNQELEVWYPCHKLWDFTVLTSEFGPL